MKIDRKYFNIVFSSVVALFMSFFMSFFLTAINVGFSRMFIWVWVRSFLTGFVISLPVSVAFIPKIRKWLDKFFAGE